MIEGTPAAPNDTVSPDAQAPATPPAPPDHYHQLVSSGERAWAKRTLARIVALVASVLEYAHEHRKAILAAVPAVVAYAAARGVTVPATLLTVVPFVVGAVPNRKPTS